MDIMMRVHRVSSHHVERSVIHEGDEVMAMVSELEVELVDAGDCGHGSMTLHFRARKEIAEAQELFPQGGIVTLSFAGGPVLEAIAT